MTLIVTTLGRCLFELAELALLFRSSGWFTLHSERMDYFEVSISRFVMRTHMSTVSFLAQLDPGFFAYVLRPLELWSELL